MSSAWTLTDLEFLVLWEEINDDFLPLPLTFASDAPDWDVLDAAKNAARDALRPRRDYALAELMDDLANADIRVAVYGWDAAEPEKPDGRIRMHGARKGDRGYVVRQLPGKTIWHSAGFEITRGDALGLAEAVVAALPEAMAGRDADVLLVAPPESGAGEPDYSYGNSDVWDTFEDSVTSRAEQFLARPAATRGAIEIGQGRSRFGPRGMLRQQIGWWDVVDDGRYAVPPGSPRVASGVDARRLVAMINTEIATVVRAIKDEWA
ncbi:ESX secretion-associated protein EspG [Nocardia sp. NPDC052566]|uniref:ESX secretion-associated protein EspG n=1 Tax=Nocardia sp. NPDC052566 TaxID=3364330 RepID=UPI0037C9D22D